MQDNRNEMTVRRLALEFGILYAAYIFLSLLFALAYETLPEAKGTFAGNAGAEYIIDTVCILLTLLLVPLSVRVFARMLTRHASLSFPERVVRYRILWGTRLISFAIITVFDLWAYYATVNNIGGFCALICIVTSLLFIPTRRHIREDLDSNNGQPR